MRQLTPYILAFLAAGCLVPQAEETVSPRQTVVEYRPGLLAAKYAPDLHGAAQVPVLVFLHGGAWGGGSCLDHEAFLRDMAEGLGCLVVSADYRLATKDTPSYPGVLDDVAAAVAYAKSLPRANPDCVILMGFSAGGHLALLHAFREKDVALVVACSAPADLTAHRYLGAKELTGDPALFPEASPVNRACPNAPPVLLLRGERDIVVPIAQAVAMRDALREAGGSVRLQEIPGLDHALPPSITLRGAIVQALASR